MPALRQASMSSVPAGAVSFFPSTVKVTSGIFVPRRLESAVFRKRHGKPLNYILFCFAFWIEFIEVHDRSLGIGNGFTCGCGFAEVQFHCLPNIGAGVVQRVTQRTAPWKVGREGAPVVCALFVYHEIFACHFSPACLRIL